MSGNAPSRYGATATGVSSPGAAKAAGCIIITASVVINATHVVFAACTAVLQTKLSRIDLIIFFHCPSGDVVTILSVKFFFLKEYGHSHL